MFAAGIGYGLLGMPIQVTDSYGNMVQASQGTLGELVYKEFYQAAYLRPFLWGLLRVVLDLSGGHYFAWFRGFHVAQLALLVVLFVRLVRVREAIDFAVVPIGLATLVGIHTFAGTINEAFPINTFLTILLCGFAAADLALGPPRLWRDVAAVVLFVFSALTVESGLLIAVILVAARLAGARGVSRAGVVLQVVLVAGYFVLRFGVLQIGSPGLQERSSGFGFTMRDPDELIAMFGGSPIPFYAYNVLSSMSSLLFSEPRAGIWRVTQAVIEGEPSVTGVINVASSVLATTFIAAFAWSRRAEWRAGRLGSDDQLVVVFMAVGLANAAISYAYTKDVILSPAGAFFALALAVSARHVLNHASRASVLRATATGLVLLALSAGWAFRALGAQIALRHAAEAVRVEWAYVDGWLERQGIAPTRPEAVALKEQLQRDAIFTHPARPPLEGDWLEWFEDQ